MPNPDAQVHTSPYPLGSSHVTGQPLCVVDRESCGLAVMLSYDEHMAQSVEIALDTVIADAKSVFERVERDQDTVTVLHFGTPVAVICPAPVEKTMGDEHREMLENPPQDSQFLDVMETRRLLGL